MTRTLRASSMLRPSSVCRVTAARCANDGDVAAIEGCAADAQRRHTDRAWSEVPGSDWQRGRTGQRGRRESEGRLAAVIRLCLVALLLLALWMRLLAGVRCCCGETPRGTAGSGHESCGSYDTPLHTGSPPQPHERADRHSG